VKVLIADDDPVSRRLLEVTLANSGYQVLTAIDGGEALSALEEKDSPRLVILDWVMPQFDGVDVCRAIRTRALEPYTYIILLTVKGEQKEIIEGLEAGADDYITKPFDLLELKARLRAGRRILDLQDQLVASREQMRFEARHDVQTGLLNHSAILENLAKEVLRARREETDLGVIMVDLDHFKSVNDKFGHMAGDAVLREVARRLRSETRPYDYIGRYGGEEFVVLAPGCNLENTKMLAERLRASIASKPISDAAISVAVTASLGVSEAVNNRSADEILKATDEALYDAKAQGRNRVVAKEGLSPVPASSRP
jgi:two-component system, cell cycle response regulator